MKSISRTLLASGALPIAAYLLSTAACSSNSPSGGGFGGNPGNNGPSGTMSGSSGGDNGATANTSSGTNGGSNGTSNGSTVGSSSGTGVTSTGGSSGSVSGSSGGGGSSTDSGSSSDGPSGEASWITAGCGQGTSCTPGNDLAPPASGAGYQIATPAMAIAVQPGQEQFLCYYSTLPNTSTIDIGAFQSWMTPGSSHHFIAYEVGSGSAGGFGAQANGTLQSCQFGGGTWMYATSLPGTIVEMQMPTGVGLPVNAGTQVMLNMHFINPGSSTAYPQVKMNILTVQNIKYAAAAMISFNTQINVPAATAAGPGMQTVNGTCSAPVGSNFFVMTTHTHKHATLSTVSYVSGGMTTQLTDTTDWEHPDVAVFKQPNFLTTKAGDYFTYSCSYSNTGSAPVTVGETAASNEMCMAIAYYFPAGTASCN